MDATEGLMSVVCGVVDSETGGCGMLRATVRRVHALGDVSVTIDGMYLSLIHI